MTRFLQLQCAAAVSILGKKAFGSMPGLQCTDIGHHSCASASNGMAVQ